jgi:hypothetical protein
MVLYALWRVLAGRGVQESHVAAPARDWAHLDRTFQTRRSAVLLDAAIREEANRKAREKAKTPRNRNVVYVRHEWECRWWSDRFGVTQDALRLAVCKVGPMVADVERYFRTSVRPAYPRAA